MNSTRKKNSRKKGRQKESERSKEIVQRNGIFSRTYNENTTEHNYELIEIETLTTSDAQLNVRGCYTQYTLIHTHEGT